MKFYTYSIQGRRLSNEDKHICILNLNNQNKNINAINLLGVFDGHGGKVVSKYLKNNLPQYFMHKFKENFYLKTKLATKYFIKIFNILQNNLIADHPRASQYCGSTACLCIHFIDSTNKDRLWVLNVGDSRLVKCNEQNIAEQLTNDHKPSQPSEKIRIEKLGGKIEFDGIDWRIKDLSLSRAFGDLDSRPYITHLPQIFNYKITTKDKFLILACDGLWDVLSNQDAVDFIINLTVINFTGNFAKAIAEHAYDKGSLDNITVIIYFFS
jgi:serine/threonine protein phosphatase PrpC